MRGDAWWSPTRSLHSACTIPMVLATLQPADTVRVPPPPPPPPQLGLVQKLTDALDNLELQARQNALPSARVEQPFAIASH